MARILHYHTFRNSPILSDIALAIFWCGGLGVAICFFNVSGGALGFVMQSLEGFTVFLGSMLFSALIPWVLSGLAVLTGHPRWIYAICFCKAFLYGYLCCGIGGGYGNAGWLIRYLLFFEDTLGNVLLYLFWSHQLRKPMGFSGFLCYVTIICLVSAASYCCIFPLVPAGLL